MIVALKVMKKHKNIFQNGKGEPKVNHSFADIIIEGKYAKKIKLIQLIII